MVCMFKVKFGAKGSWKTVSQVRVIGDETAEQRLALGTIIGAFESVKI